MEERSLLPLQGVLIKAVTITALCCCLCTLATAQKNKPTRVWDSILGVRIGSTQEEARSRLRALGTLGGEKNAKMDEADDEERREGGSKEAWALKKGKFAYVVYRSNPDGRVVWVSGFVRPGREIPFDKLGDLTRAAGKSDAQVAWSVQTPTGAYRLVAKGLGGKARVVYLFSLAAPVKL